MRWRWFVLTLLWLGSCSGCVGVAVPLWYDLDSRVARLEFAVGGVLALQHDIPIPAAECIGLSVGPVLCEPTTIGHCECYFANDEDYPHEDEEEMYPWEWDDEPGIDL